MFRYQLDLQEYSNMIQRGGGSSMAIVLILIILIVGGVVGFLIMNGTIKLGDSTPTTAPPGLGSGPPKTTSPKTTPPGSTLPVPGSTLPVPASTLPVPASTLPASSNIKWSHVTYANFLPTVLCRNGTTGAACPNPVFTGTLVEAQQVCLNTSACEGILKSAADGNSWQMRTSTDAANFAKGWPSGLDMYLKTNDTCTFNPNMNIPTPICPPGSSSIAGAGRCHKPTYAQAKALCDSLPGCNGITMDSAGFEPRKSTSDVPMSSMDKIHSWSC